MSFTRPGLQTELDRFFKAIASSPDCFDTISKSAFTQSRKKLKPEAFIELMKGQLNYFNEHAPFKKYWKSKRIVAIDGSILNLPYSEEIKKEFGFVTNSFQENISAMCSFAYDVENELVLNAIIDPVKTSEKDLVVEHLAHLNPDTDILVFDRGYPALWLMGLLAREGFKFCFRLNSAWKDAVQLAQSNKVDIDWVYQSDAPQVRPKLKKYGLPSKVTGLRLVCIELPNGQKEILATNLTNREIYSIEDLKTLYHKRWGIEESYKTFKKVLHIEHFTGKTALSVRQDFHARVFMLNMASMIASQGLAEKNNEREEHRKYKSKPNKTQTLAKTKDFLFDIFYRKKELKRILDQLIHLIARSFEIIRPGRSFKRSNLSVRKRHTSMTSKGI
jgi:hypothetical protein